MIGAEATRSDLNNLALHHIPQFEGMTLHMYLDTRGLVTVGVGCMLPTPAAAAVLPFEVSGKRATEAVIKLDFVRVMGATPGLPAKRYALMTGCRLTPASVESLFESRCAGFVATLTKALPSFPTFPIDAQLALLDMAFNMGAGELTKHWPKLMAACAAKDWAKAGKQCLRFGVQPQRNADTVQLFKDAGAA